MFSQLTERSSGVFISRFHFHVWQVVFVTYQPYSTCTAEPRRKSATAALRLSQAHTLVKGLMADRRYNTALLIGAGIYFGLRIGDIL